MKRGFRVYPRSRKEIELLANTIRGKFDLDNKPYFPIVDFLEFGLSQVFGVEYDIRPQSELGTDLGRTLPERKTILLSNNVYEKACEGNGWGRFTIAHEVGHFFMHNEKYLARGKDEHKPYEDSEWQADTFAGALLAPSHLTQNLSVTEIVQKCGLSFSAAEVQYKINNTVRIRRSRAATRNPRSLA